MDSNVSFQHSSVEFYFLTMYRTKKKSYVPINIEEFINFKIGQVFGGNVVVMYRAILDKSEKSTKILCILNIGKRRDVYNLEYLQ
jgi:hypothetical protein